MTEETRYEFASRCVVGTETLTVEKMKQRIKDMQRTIDFLLARVQMHESEMLGINLTIQIRREEIERLTKLIERETCPSSTP